MKVLMIGVNFDGTGWAHAANELAMAMDAVGIEVALRPIKLNTCNDEVNEKIREMHARSSRNSDFCIQVLPPSMYEASGSFAKRIGYFFSETDSIAYSDWPAKLNCMDEAWTPTRSSLNTARRSGVCVPTKLVHVPCDLNKYNRSYEVMPLRKETEGRFLFYTIGDVLNKRKNLLSLLMGFHLEFDPSEPVDLVIKSDVPADEVRKFCSMIKKGLRLYPEESCYRRELVIDARLSEADMCRLHTSCDCYVSVSHGEGWNLPAFDALGFGKTPILSDTTAHREYMKDSDGWLVETHEQPVFGVDPQFENISTGRENWDQVGMDGLRYSFREAYSMSCDARNYLASTQRSVTSRFSYEIIGNQIKELLLK